MVRHSIAYPTLYPVEATRIDLQNLFNSSPLLQGSHKEREWLPHSYTPLRFHCFQYTELRIPCRAEVSLVLPAEREPESSSILYHTTYNTVPNQSARPVQRDLCDSRLAQLQIRKWTDVSISDSLAAAAISLYLETHHPILGLFDVDLFLNDLISYKRDFCSPLLVCALLCSACVSNPTSWYNV